MKLKFSFYTIAAGIVWIACFGFMGVGTLLSGGTFNPSLEQARRDLQESREKLTFAENAGKEETKRKAGERFTKTQESLNTFTCPSSAESALIFQIGQLAHSLELKKFTGRIPESSPEKTLEKSERIVEGWLAVEFVADYLRTAAFINSLECNNPVLFVESISMSRSEDNIEEASVKINLSYLIQKTEKTKAVAQANSAD
jgi:hypothetical protein